MPPTRVPSSPMWYRPDPENIGLLKAELKKALEEIEAHEKLAAEKTAQQTLEWVEVLEGRLHAALAELAASKAKVINSCN